MSKYNETKFLQKIYSETNILRYLYENLWNIRVNFLEDYLSKRPSVFHIRDDEVSVRTPYYTVVIRLLN